MNVGVNDVVEVLSQREDGAPAARPGTNGAPAARPGTELYSIVVQLCFCLLFSLSLSCFDTLTVDLISHLDI